MHHWNDTFSTENLTDLSVFEFRPRLVAAAPFLSMAVK